MTVPHQKDKRPLVFHSLVIAVIIAALGGAAYMRYQDGTETASSAEAALAQCLTDKGVKFYGAYWCSHCSSQKKLFRKGVSKLPYVECASPGNPQQQTQECQDANITGYPTWIFPDGDRRSGEQSLKDLASKSGCAWEPLN